MISLDQSFKSIQNQINANKTYIDTSQAASKLEAQQGDSQTGGLNTDTSQLSSIEKNQKRYERDNTTSMDRVMSLLSDTRGSGSATIKYLRKKIIEAFLKIEPIANEILTQESLKAIGCSQEQTYNGTDPFFYDPATINLLPKQTGIYLPVKFLDLFSNLKNSATSSVGAIFYEKQQPSKDSKFKPYGGKVPFPMNKALREIMNPDNTNRSFGSVYGATYNGVSGQKLFDVVYSNQDSFGVTGDYFRIILFNKDSQLSESSITASTGNKVGQFLKDYYGTIKIVDNVNVTAQIVNILTNAVDMKAQVGFGQLNENKKFFLLLQRILGLCFDDRREIDVSGTAKVAELDGVDDSFWELNEINLRNIDGVISDIQNKVVEFEDCNGVKLPVNYESLVQQLVELRETFNDNSIEKNTQKIESIIDSISENSTWKPLVPTSLNVGLSINKNFIRQIPLAVVASILTPKVLLPIFALLYELEKSALNQINSGIVDVNKGISAYNSINTPTDFMKKFKEFVTQVTSKISAEFLKTLTEILKKDIINMLNMIVKDINKNSQAKQISMIIRILQVALIVIPAITDYRKCKSLVDDIMKLLSLINTGGLQFPSLSLLKLSALLPGKSPIRAAINAFENIQKLGMPTGDLPDGSPNLMNQLILSIMKGADKEESENGKTMTSVELPPPFGLLLTAGKSM